MTTWQMLIAAAIAAWVLGFLMAALIGWLHERVLRVIVADGQAKASAAWGRACKELAGRMAEVGELRAEHAKELVQAVNDERELALAQRDKLLGVLVMVAPIVLDRAKLRVGQPDGEHAAWIMAGLNHLGVWRPTEKDSRVLARGIQVAGRDRELFQKSFALPVGLRRPPDPEAT